MTQKNEILYQFSETALNMISKEANYYLAHFTPTSHFYTP